MARLSETLPSNCGADAASFAICTARSLISTAPSFPWAAKDDMIWLMAWPLFGMSPSAVATSPAADVMSERFVPVARDSFAICSRMSRPVARSPVLPTNCPRPSIASLASMPVVLPTEKACLTRSFRSTRMPFRASPAMKPAFARSCAFDSSSKFLETIAPKLVSTPAPRARSPAMPIAAPRPAFARPPAPRAAADTPLAIVALKAALCFAARSLSRAICAIARSLAFALSRAARSADAAS